MHPKVAGSTIAGAIVVIGAWALKRFAGIDLPAEVAGAVTALLGVAIGYLIPDPPAPAA